MLYLISAIALGLLGFFVRAWIGPIMRRRKALANISGPEWHSFRYGHVMQRSHGDALPWMQENVRRHGLVMAFDGFYGDKQLFVADPWAMHQIAMKDEVDYGFPPIELTISQYTAGAGLFHAVGHEHRRQRKMLLPLFSPGHLRKMVDIFSVVSERLKEALVAQAEKGITKIDLHSWTARSALEMIAQSGFGTSFDSLEAGFQNTYIDVVRPFGPVGMQMLPLLPLMTFMMEKLPVWVVTTFLKNIPFKPANELVQMRKRMQEESLLAIRANRELVEAERTAEKDGEKISIKAGDDLFANLLRNYPAGSEEVSDSVLVAQMNFLIVAAMDTTSGAVARTVQLLSQNPAVQNRLRDEIQQALTAADTVDYDLLSNLPYLDAVCRETLRLHAPVQSTNRYAAVDTVLDLGRPIIGKDGKEIKQVFLPKGTRVILGLGYTNVDREIWGDDCLEWNPERWTKPLPENVLNSHIPGLYSKLMTFWAGPRACLGFSFSQFEMKCLLVHLISELEFTPAKEKIEWKLTGVMSPSTEDGREGLPINVSRVKAA